VGRALLIGRLAVRDLRRRPVEAVLLLLAITAATTTLTLGLVLQDAAQDPYQTTREATAGPDVVAGVNPSPDEPANITSLEALTGVAGVVDHSGPYPAIGAVMELGDETADVQAIGRDPAPASLDQPEVTKGSWVRDGGVVVEATLADALGVGEGDPVTLNGRSFRVVGVAVSAASAPDSCLVPCYIGPPLDQLPPSEADEADEADSMVFCHDADSDPPLVCVVQSPGLVWMTQGDVRSVAPQPEALTYLLNLRLDDPSTAPEFAEANNACPPDRPCRSSAPGLTPWQEIRDDATENAASARQSLVTGGSLLAVLALASVAVLVGGRMADQSRRVGLLKAIGGTPGLVAVVLLAEYVVLALIAATAGLGIGRLVAPVLIGPASSLLGSASVPPLTTSTVGVVAAIALGVVILATSVPARRAARTSTVLALADAARAPRRTAWLIAVSTRLPVPLLVGLRVLARRPRRVALGVASIAVTVSGLVAALAAHADLDSEYFVGMTGRLEEVRTDYLNQVLLVLVVMLLTLAAVNAVFVTWTTALDTRHAAALTQALGATPGQIGLGLSLAQVLPALLGALLGIPGGLALLAALDGTASQVPAWQFLAVVPATGAAVALLTTLTARFGSRRPTAEILQAELA
jgi:ABC-type lipoprotein release transport system permease subunit